MKAWIERSGGWLLPIASLPSGHLGADAVRMLDLAAAGGIRVWQILPVGPPAKHDNPFESESAFAGNTLLLEPGAVVEPRACAEFRDANADWLADWALFTALKREQAGAPWWDWPAGLKNRDDAAIKAARRRLKAAIEAESLAQCAFESAWAGFRAAAHERGVELFGDVPLFVSHDSADVWAQRALFEVDAEGLCEATVGVPPDAFSETGQHWGFPPYRWDVMAHGGFAWWKRRFEVQARRFDLVRLDHFRAFAAWWRIPRDARSAIQGEWILGPGDAAVECLQPVLQGAQLVAEDLGIITDDVVALRHRLGIPGMRVLQFAFDGNPANPHLPGHHGPDTICYTGTHDNNTTYGWWRSLNAQEREHVVRYLAQPDPAMPRALVECAWASPAPLAIVPVQDLLGLGTEARMNRPGIAENNWRWRLRWDQITPAFAASLRQDLRRHGR